MTLKTKIIDHYDKLSPYYKDLWGIHIHHGYWKTGKETKEEAQEQLIRELISRAGIGKRMRILDVGCGIGGTAIYLNKYLDADVTGATISVKQIEIGNKLAKESNADVRLMLMDAERLEISDTFDVVWCVEAISHFNEKKKFFHSSARLLKAGGKLVIADWLRSDSLSEAEQRKYIKPIEKAMLVPKLESPAAYINYISEEGLKVKFFDDVSSNVSRTWDISSKLVQKPALWKFATTRGPDFIAFLNGFTAMKAGYKSKALIYGLIVAEKL